jgi:hypothetical protein
MSRNPRGKFISLGSEMGQKIQREPRYARFESWLGQRVEVDTASAEYRTGTNDLTVFITRQDGKREKVRIAMVTGLSLQEREALHEVALDKRGGPAPAHMQQSEAPAVSPAL